ncbi:hypothetical protein SSX86_022360 [Deinandra increscens subsp. villosa]|uniref:Uncharacterized protein n=1 Tax=Deinandra increscens subsp. villosa TaxID=3103831 RepID=A0AAP0GR97_9ASTR
MSLPEKICMNDLCGATTSGEWKRGWPMKVGGVATLCFACGTEYDHARYCEQFHLNQPGWRECKYCYKPVHCGCVVSKYLHECLDSGGISCINCVRAKPLQKVFFPLPRKHSTNEIPDGFSRFAGNWLPSIFTNRMNNITPLTEGPEKHQLTSLNSFKEFSTGKVSGSSFKSSFPLSTIFSNQSPLSTQPNNNKQNLGSNSVYKPQGQQSIGFSVLPTYNGVAEEKVPSSKKEQKSGVSIWSKSNKGTDSGSGNRVGRPPGESKGHRQMLARYWPKMTDQELMQIHGDLNANCTVTPLFEKILSASDAGRIGRLILPKACAEAYFPRIDQSEGVPIKFRDIKGKEWTFQFRFWPNNNSRMYVLEGIALFIQIMQLQAGDTVIFSRIEPEDKLVIFSRKASVLAEPSALTNPVSGGAIVCTDNANLPSNIEHEGTSNRELVKPSVIQEEKKARNIGSKSKRLHMHSEDALELKLTWEEAQEYLRPPTSKPTVVTIEDCELEEYHEPPVFGKKIIFTTNKAKLQEQWVQCDSCSKWRKLPSDVLVPSKWTCSDNISDPNRRSCSVPEEQGVKQLGKILKLSKECKKRKVAKTGETKQVGPTGLDESVPGPTTRHPRHRPGCSCIVCIQPPSGKGNHKPNCICNVCLTVRRRFKTLMLRRKKRVAEQEAEMILKSQAPVTNPAGSGDGLGTGTGTGIGPSLGPELDLNCDPTEDVWRNVLAQLVPNGTSDMKDGLLQTNNKQQNKAVEGS